MPPNVGVGDHTNKSPVLVDDSYSMMVTKQLSDVCEAVSSAHGYERIGVREVCSTAISSLDDDLINEGTYRRWL